MRILLSLSLMALIGCASGPVKKESKTIENITDADFQKIKKVQFTKEDDYFSDVKSEVSGALNDESLERAVMYDGEIDLKNPISKIAKNCYKKNFKDAFIIVKNISKTYRENPIFWNQVGTCYLIQGERRKALLFYNKALDLKSNYVPALNNLGTMYFREGDYERSLVAFERAIKTSEFSKTPRYNLASLYLHFGLYDKSLSYSMPLYDEGKKDVDVLNMVASAYLMKNDATTALTYYNQIESNYRERADIGLNYSLALLSVGRIDNARDTFEDIDKKSIKHLSPYYKRVQRVLGVK